MTNHCLLENCLTTWPVAPTDLCGECNHQFVRHIEASDTEDAYCGHWCNCGEFVPIPEYCNDTCARIAKNLDDFDAIGDNQRDRDR